MENEKQNHMSDLEMGGYGKEPRSWMFYVRDFTYRVVPLCALILVFFSDGAILVCTLAFEKPVPKRGVIVISVMLAVLFLLFGVGGMYIYHRKYYPLLPRDVGGAGWSRPSSEYKWHRKLAGSATKYAPRLSRYVAKHMRNKRTNHEEPSRSKRNTPMTNRPVGVTDEDELAVAHPSHTGYVSVISAWAL